MKTTLKISIPTITFVIITSSMARLSHNHLLHGQVVYSNQKPAYYLNRQFKIICSELSDRFTSNEYVQTVCKQIFCWNFLYFSFPVLSQNDECHDEMFNFRGYFPNLTQIGTDSVVDLGSGLVTQFTI